ncbi:mitochondria-eating protein [Caerostris darwini]|uniref:Mitochondria-eating protein n=1 Tax=Caerostris darwini TaxID=1538125 RepID=A0AAV4TYK4_9ARAC|nr:mitochondria-eating protein [Caerostris darwini]
MWCKGIQFRFGNRNSNRSSSSSSDNQSFSGEGSAKGFPVTSTKGSFARHFDIPSEDSRCSSRVDSTPVDCRTLCKLPNSPVPSAQQLTTGTPSSATSQDWKIAALRREVSVLKAELNQTRINIEFFQQRELKMKERLAEQARVMLDRGVRFENVGLGERRPTALIRRYGNLYAQSRVDTLDALDSIPELQHAYDLKSKILFSAVVLSFRSVYHTICEIKSRIRHILQISEEKERSSDTTIRDLDTCINAYMKKSVDRFDVRKNLEEVLSQIFATLYDYPSLKTCEGLKHYVKDCLRIAWSLSNQCPPFVIEYEERVFRKDLHVRFHTSNQESDRIKTYLWPTLMEGRNGPCVHKGVVIT